MNRLDIDDVFFMDRVSTIHADGDGREHRLRQAAGRRFIAWEEGGWVFFRARRTIMVPRSNIANMVMMTPERRKELGPNQYEPKVEAKK